MAVFLLMTPIVCSEYLKTESWQFYDATGLQWGSSFELIEMKDNVSTNLRADTTRTMIVKINNVSDSLDLQNSPIRFRGQTLRWRSGPIGTNVPLDILDMLKEPLHEDCLWCATQGYTGGRDAGYDSGVYLYDKRFHIMYIWLQL